MTVNAALLTTVILQSSSLIFLIFHYQISTRSLSNFYHILNFTLIFYSIFPVLKNFSSFYLDIFCNWKRYFSTHPETPSCILAQYLWFNKFIIVDNSYLNFTYFSNKNINFVSDLLNQNCNFKRWGILKNRCHSGNKLDFQWMQLIHAIPLISKQKINDSKKNVEKNYFVRDHRLIKKQE